MSTITSYKDLEVWQRSMMLVEACYSLTRSFPAAERFGLTNQIRRAAVSIPSNVAEGHRQRSRGNYLRHLGIALGSHAELETHIELAGRLGLVTNAEAAQVEQLLHQVGRLLHGLVRSLVKKGFSTNPQSPTPNPCKDPA